MLSRPELTYFHIKHIDPVYPSGDGQQVIMVITRRAVIIQISDYRPGCLPSVQTLTRVSVLACVAGNPFLLVTYRRYDLPLTFYYDLLLYPSLISTVFLLAESSSYKSLWKWILFTRPFYTS